MHLIWVISKEIFLKISWFNICGIRVLLAVLSEKVTDNNAKCNPDNQDLEHEPEVNVSSSLHAFVSLSLEINELHEHEDTKLKQGISTYHIAVEQLSLLPTKVYEGD